MAVAIASLSASFSSFQVSQAQNPAKSLKKSFLGSPLRTQIFQANKKWNDLRLNGTPTIRMTAATAPAPALAPNDSEKLDLPKYVKSRLPGGFAAQRLIGTGRRKTAVARVVLLEGSGKIIINGRTAQEYLQGNPLWLQYLKYPLATLGYETKYDVFVKAEGGGLSGQAQATLLGIARALCKANPDNRDPLKKQGLLTRDPRKVERKKVGLHKARKAPQFSKR